MAPPVVTSRVGEGGVEGGVEVRGEGGMVLLDGGLVLVSLLLLLLLRVLVGDDRARRKRALSR